MALHANVPAQQNLSQVAFANDRVHIAGSDFVTRVAVSHVADVIDAEVHALTRDSEHMRALEAIPEMADHDPWGSNTFLPKQGDLLERQFAEMSGVRHDGRVCTKMCASGGAEHALLCGS